MGYAFISYSSKQQTDADRLRHLLKNNGIDTWMAPYDIPEGCEYSDVITGAIQNAACLVLLLTEDAQRSTYVDKEIERALHYGKTIAPIQLDSVTLNDSFSFYLCNQQIAMVPAIDEGSPKVQTLITHLQYLCNDRLPSNVADMNAARDRRVRRRRISRLFVWGGIILFCVSLFLGVRHVTMSVRSTYMEMYGMDYIPGMAAIARSYIIYFCMAVAAVLAALYGFGLRDPKKNTWNPLLLFPMHLMLPALSAVCGAGCAMLRLAQSSVSGIVRGLEIYNESSAGYALPRWISPVTWIFTVAFIVSALLSLVLMYIRGKRNGFAFIKELRENAACRKRRRK